jgi:hypothetical protein
MNYDEAGKYAREHPTFSDFDDPLFFALLRSAIVKTPERGNAEGATEPRSWLRIVCAVLLVLAIAVGGWLSW